jgi:hypothetical protein
MTKKLMAALGAYAAIALLAAFTLDGGLMRNAVWVLMGAFALKTYIAYRAGWHSSGGEHRGAEGEKSGGDCEDR